MRRRGNEPLHLYGMRSKAGGSTPPVYSAHVKNRCCIEDFHHTIHVIMVEREGGHPNYVHAGKPLVVERLECLRNVSPSL